MDTIEYLPYLGFLAPLIVIGFFIYIIKKRNSLLDIEKNLTPIYMEDCGGRFDGYNLTIPFVRFKIYDNFIVISYTKKILLKYTDIKRIEIKRHIISKGIHIYHNKDDIPKNIIVWASNCEKLKDRIENLSTLSNFMNK